jgi:RpiB/LacA/LacB family sugar-phosphate isomerase
MNGPLELGMIPNANEMAGTGAAAISPIVIGSDHAGFPLKKSLIQAESPIHHLIDVGTDGDGPVNYPDCAVLVERAIKDGRAEKGILIYGSGVGASVAAKKMKGIRAGLCHDHYSAHQGVEHDDMNILVLGCRVVGAAMALDLAKAFHSAFFSREPRHVRRLSKISLLERNLHPVSTLQPS